MVSCRSLPLGFGLAVALVAIGSTETSAQFPISSGPPIVMTNPGVATSPPVISPRPGKPAPVPGSGGLGPTYATPPFSEARRKARVANRYTVARPVYNGRPGVSFAPYSDYYFPRIIGARETVYTTTPGGSVPVGEAAFRRPSNGVPVFPR